MCPKTRTLLWSSALFFLFASHGLGQEGWTGDLGEDADGCIAMGEVMHVLSSWNGSANTAFDADANGITSCEDLIAVLNGFGACNLAGLPLDACNVVGAMNYSPEAATSHGCLFFGAIPVGSDCVLAEEPCDPAGPCAGICTVLYGGVEYSTVAVGNQCWFAQNLRTVTFSDGSQIPTAEESGAIWHTAEQPLQCAYENSTSNVNSRGLLYNGYAVLDERGLCPSGWHVPSDAEFMELESHLGMAVSALPMTGWRSGGQGKMMKASTADEPGWNGTNTSGLSILPEGLRSGVSSSFLQDGVSAYLFTSTLDENNRLQSRYLYVLSEGVYRGPARLTSGYSVRCLKD